MSRCRRTSLVVRALVELMLYDLVLAIWGFSGVNRRARRRAPARQHEAAPGLEAAVVDAVTCASSLYWKPVRCLQRSVVTARVLSRYGIRSEVVIGYRPVPFFSHAWVEVNGKVANDLSGYRERLLVLERL